MTATGDRPGNVPAGVSDQPALAISREKVCEIIFKAREYDAEEAATIPDDDSDPVDEEERSLPEGRPDDAVEREIAGLINAMNVDEQVDLVALMWLGRGDGALADWADLRETAAAERHATARYLLGTPLLADFLAEGLAQFGYSCEEFADENLA